MDVTLASVVDVPHAAELALTAPILMENRPESRTAPWVVVVDVMQRSLADWRKQISEIIPHAKVVPSRSPSHWPQRERMLSEFIYTVPSVVETKWFAKCDTDAFPVTRGRLVEPTWLESDPVFVSSSWGYSKPATAMHSLDAWGDTVPAIARFPRLNIPFDPSWSRVVHPRIISFFYVGQTDWHRALSTLVGERLPLPSQDSVCWFVAERTKAFYRKVRFSKLGWRHIGNGGERLKRAVEEALK